LYHFLYSQGDTREFFFGRLMELTKDEARDSLMVSGETNRNQVKAVRISQPHGISWISRHWSEVSADFVQVLKGL